MYKQSCNAMQCRGWSRRKENRARKGTWQCITENIAGRVKMRSGQVIQFGNPGSYSRCNIPLRIYGVFSRGLCGDDWWHGRRESNAEENIRMFYLVFLGWGGKRNERWTNHKWEIHMRNPNEKTKLEKVDSGILLCEVPSCNEFSSVWRLKMVEQKVMRENDGHVKGHLTDRHRLHTVSACPRSTIPMDFNIVSTP